MHSSVHAFTPYMCMCAKIVHRWNVYLFLSVHFRSRRLGGCNGSLRTEAFGCSVDGDGQFASDTPRFRTLVHSSALLWSEALRWKSNRFEASATEV